MTYLHSSSYRSLFGLTGRAPQLGNSALPPRLAESILALNVQGLCQVKNTHKYTVLSLAKKVCTFLAERSEIGVFHCDSLLVPCGLRFRILIRKSIYFREKLLVSWEIPNLIPSNQSFLMLLN